MQRPAGEKATGDETEDKGRSSVGVGKRQSWGKNRMADQLATDIIAKIKAHAEPGGEEITTNTELTALGIHSLELTEIIFDLEEEYGIEIEMNTVDAWSNLKNVGDMVEAVRALIEKKA
jgi:nodulation protein F